jgi:hypothetical protein
MANKFSLIGAIALTSFLLGACAKEKELTVVAVPMERPKPAMPTTCYKDGTEKFKPVTKVAGDKTPAGNALQALQSNKSRMSKNDGRVRDCECWIAGATQNESDNKRLEGLCQLPEPELNARKAGT